MALQIKCDELEGCESYLHWIMSKIGFQKSPVRDEIGEKKEKYDPKVSEISSQGQKNGMILGNLANHHTGEHSYILKTTEKVNCAGGVPFGEMVERMFERDFIVEDIEIKEDEIRATDAMELRRRYADEIGSELGKSEHDIDRIWKSIHGKCSILELIVSLCFRLDEMVNEDEPGTMVSSFFMILIRNLGLVLPGNYPPISTGLPFNEDQILDRFLKREYEQDGTGGGLFPLSEWDGVKDQRKVPIWYQMNAWLAEHMDEEEHFCE